MHQPMQGAMAQVERRKVKSFYDDGWNGYIEKIPFQLMQSEDAQDGWLDCQEATKKYGKQKPI